MSTTANRWKRNSLTDLLCKWHKNIFCVQNTNIQNFWKLYLWNREPLWCGFRFKWMYHKKSRRIIALWNHVWMESRTPLYVRIIKVTWISALPEVILCLYPIKHAISREYMASLNCILYVSSNFLHDLAFTILMLDI